MTPGGSAAPDPPAAGLDQAGARLALLAPELHGAVRARLLDYLVLLRRWNRAYNLTAVRDLPTMVTQHLMDSLSLRPYLHGRRMLDAGSGAGLPGMVLALVHPDQHWLLVDASGKKTRFLTQAVLELGLANVEVRRQRLESLRPEAGFDTVTVRALGSLAEVYRLTRPLLAPGGRLLLMKGAYPGSQLQALAALGVVSECHGLEVPGLEAERHLVSVQAADGD